MTMMMFFYRKGEGQEARGLNYSSTINGKHAGAANILPDHHIEDHYNVGDGDENDDRDF